MFSIGVVFAFAAAGAGAALAAGAADVLLLIGAILVGSMAPRFAGRPDIPSSLAIDGPRLVLFHGPRAYAEVELSDVSRIEGARLDHSGNPSEHGYKASRVELRCRTREGLKHFYVFADLQGYGELVLRLLAATEGDRDVVHTRSWSLSREGKRDVFNGLFVACGIALCLAFVSRSLLFGPLGLSGQGLVFGLLFCLGGLIGFALVARSLAHTATSIRWRPDELEVTSLWVRRKRIARESFVGCHLLPADRGQSERYRVSYWGGFFDISPEYYDDYADLVACCKELAGELS